jgi:hypothetical protein
MVSGIANNAWVQYDTVDYTPDNGFRGPVRVSLRVASTVATNTIEVRLGSSTGTLLRTLTVPSTGSLTTWNTISDTVPVRATGIQNVALVFRVPSGSNNLNVNWASFGQELIPSSIDAGLAALSLNSGFPCRRTGRNAFTVDFPENASPPEVRLFSLKGQEIRGSRGALASRFAGAGREVVSLGAALAPGTYFLSIKGGGRAVNVPFVY